MGFLDFGTIKSNYFMSFCLNETKIKIRTQPIYRIMGGLMEILGKYWVVNELSESTILLM
jgi:hypothetical protein